MNHVKEINEMMRKDGISEHAAISRYRVGRIIAEQQRRNPLEFRRATNLYK
jgi:hypothetical protein